MNQVPSSRDTDVLNAVSERLWQSKYQYRDADRVYDQSIDDTFRRVAKALASVEQAPAVWEPQFYQIFADFAFIPGGRILAGAGTANRVTLLNCFVMGAVRDSMDGIFDALKEGALTMQQGGGVGYDFSTLRPAGAYAYAVGNVASGPVSFMRIWDSMCSTILSTGARRGAMMAALRCDHPDIETFITAKQDPAEYRNFNFSVLVTDEFMRAVREDGEYSLVFPAGSERASGPGGETVMRQWSGGASPEPCRVYRKVRARDLWQKLMRATYEYAEPGVLFIDRINQENPLHYRETIATTNPCGEVPLPPYGACDLGSLNLTRFVERPFSDTAHVDMEKLRRTIPVAVRILDNVIDVSRYPLPAQRAEAKAKRRVGLGITGLADCLVMLGLSYDSEEGREQAGAIMRAVCHNAYQASIALAREKTPFPALEADAHLKGSFVGRLPEAIRIDIANHGLRNSHLLAIAPTGSISVLANNVSSGIEPIYDLEYRRKVLDSSGDAVDCDMQDYAWSLWQQHGGNEVPDYFVTAHHLSPQAHLAMQAVLQPLVDQAISKTINVPEQTEFDEFADLYSHAYQLGLKGCTTFRSNPVTGNLLSRIPNVHCCDLDREAD